MSLQIIAWVIGIVSTGGIGYALFRWRSQIMGSKLFQAMQRQSEDEYQLEVQALREKMKEALSTLKSSVLKMGYHGQAALYRLPWVMIMGPSAAGKSTLLRHSGLHFPYSRHQEIEIKGFAGTRNCDWWFADEAIILDTAGRYTTDEEDKPEWLAFLDLLKKYRRRAPINGVMVALSLTDLLNASEDAIEDHVKIIRARLHELIKQLGVVFPVHIVLTKCDLLSGFQEYMHDLSAEAREQIWGVTFDDHAGRDNQIESSLSALYQKMCELRMHKMTLQSDNLARMNILAFPSAFKKACGKINPFISLLLKHNPYQEQPDFKGLYFTSAHQEPGPFSTATGHRQGFFIKQLFKKIVFVDKNLVHSQRTHQIDLALKVAAGLFSCVATFIAIMLFQSSYSLHHHIYERVDQLVQSHDMIGGSFSQKKWQSMNALYDEYERLNDLTEHKTLSLYALEKLGKAKEKILKAWVQDMQAIFLVPVSQYLEHDLQHQSLAWIDMTQEQQQVTYGAFYDHLKTYLMLVEPQSHMNKTYIIPRLADHWVFILQHRFPEFSLSDAKTAAMVGTFVDVMQSASGAHLMLPDNEALIGQARSLLNVNPSPETVYVHMKSELIDQLGYLDLNTLLEGNAFGLFESRASLQRLFTHEHVHRDVMPAIDAAVLRALEGDWVLNNRGMVALNNTADQLKETLRRFYFQDYANAWFDFLASIEVRSFQSIEDAADKLALLQQPMGPFSALMNAVKENVMIAETDLLPVNDKMPTVLMITELDAPFYAMRRMTQPGEKMTVAEPINQYLHLIGRVHNDLSRLAHSSNPNRDAESYARQVLSGAETELSKAVSSLSFLLDASTHSAENPLMGEKTRAALEPLLLSTFENVWESILKNTAHYLQATWDAQVMTVYQHTLRNKFPFSKTSVDATLEDVGIFFRPGDGVLNEFQENYLSPYVQWTRNGFVTQTWMNKGIDFSETYLASLSIAKRISEGLFRSSRSDVELTFYVSPVPTPGVEEVIFDTNGQMYRYRNEPEEWRRFVWPGDSSEMGARLYVSQDDHATWAEMHKPGVWGLFHLLNAGKLTREGGAQYLSQWQVKNDAGELMNIRFKLRADKQHNIFEPGLLQHFSLPENIMSEEVVTVAHQEGEQDVFFD